MYHLRLLTPEETIFEGEIVSLIVSGEEGYLGVLTDHAPLISALKEGILKITLGEAQALYYKISSGFLSVEENQASVLVQRALASSPIDLGTQGGV